ncbi:MAG: hypothetical protein IT537_06570 [Hyphomicrobiales bacterium]|nr:hypothetical protein [Hyphomicrobiales bacterium]
MSFTLAAAASATGLSKSTILRAIKDGKIAGTRDERGVWYVEPGDLHVLCPPTVPESVEALHGYSDSDIEELGAQIESLLRQAGARLRQQLDAVRHERGYDPAQDRNLHFADQDERIS